MTVGCSRSYLQTPLQCCPSWRTSEEEDSSHIIRGRIMPSFIENRSLVLLYLHTHTQYFDYFCPSSIICCTLKNDVFILILYFRLDTNRPIIYFNWHMSLCLPYQLFSYLPTFLLVPQPYYRTVFLGLTENQLPPHRDIFGVSPALHISLLYEIS